MDAQQPFVDITREGEWISPAHEVIVELVSISQQRFDDRAKHRLLFEKYV